MAGSDVLESTRARLGPVGVWLGSLFPATIDQERHAARRVEELGYGSLWTGELFGGKEVFAHQSVLLAATERIVTGAGIANVWARHPTTMHAGAATLGAAYPGRFIIGVGVSHAPAAQSSGQSYEKPLDYMTHYLDGMDAAAAEASATDVPVPRVLAAVGPKMLALARDRADGAHPYFVTPAHTAMAREVLGPDKLLIPEQAVVLTTDAYQARRIARDHTQNYLKWSNYVNTLKKLGYRDDDLVGSGSDRLVDAVVAWGDEAAIAHRVREHLDAGADHVLLQPLGNLDEALHQLQRLAPAILQSPDLTRVTGTTT